MKNLLLAIKKLLRPLKILFLFLLIPCYKFLGLLPRNKNIYIFSSWFGERYSDNSRILYEYINLNFPHIKTIWLAKNTNVIKLLKSKNKQAYKPTSIKGIYYCLRAKKIFVTTGGEINMFFCNGAEYYNLWHGMPLKKILNDDKHSKKSNANSYNEFLEKHFIWKANFTKQKKLYTISNSRFFNSFLQTAFNLPNEKILQVGSPRCDALFTNNKEILIEKIRNKYKDSKIILYMPTFRTAEWTGKEFNPFSEKFLFDEKEFFSILKKNNYIFLYKAHFSDEKFLKNTTLHQSDRFILISDKDFDELYNFVGQIDILMTDYSSIYFDFIATTKPIILTPFDFDEYIKTSREHYFDYFTNMEGIKAKNWEEVFNILEKELYYPVSEETKIKFSEYITKNCCEKLIEKIQ